MVTISDVAKLAGVSIGTVSNVLNNPAKVKQSTADLVHQAINELGFVPNLSAKGLKKENNNIIGVIAEDIASTLFSELVDGICNYFQENNYFVTLYDISIGNYLEEFTPASYKKMEQSQEFKARINNTLSQLASMKVAGIIYIGSFPRIASVLPKELTIPVVYTYCLPKEAGYSVNYDDFQGTKEAVSYIIEKGHKKIGIITGTVNSLAYSQRMLGFQSALMEKDVPLIPDYIKMSDWRAHNSYLAAKELLMKADPPTAIFVMSDVMACGAIRGALELGFRVPQDVSIHGFDGLPIADLFVPRISTVKIPLVEMGTQSAQLLLELITGVKIEQKRYELPCIHSEGESVGPPSA